MPSVHSSEGKNYFYSEVKQSVDGQKRYDDFKEEQIESGPTIGSRHVQIALYFLLGFVAFSFRVSLSVGLVAMMDPSASSNPNVPSFPHWTKKNVILSSFFWGYVIPQSFAAHLAKKYGAKWFLVCAIFTQSVLSILTPVIACEIGEGGIMASRAVEGFTQGFIFPSCTHLLSQWVPPQERSRWGSVMFSAGKLGTLFSMFFMGMISSTTYGWPWAFRILGFFGLIWCVLMTFFGYNSPRDHPRINQIEKVYIEKSLGHDDRHHKFPWKAVFTSPHVYAILCAQIGQNYAFWTLLTQIPSYMNYVMKFDLKSNSLWSSVPYLAMFILSYVFGFISDAIINKGIVSRGTARKIFNSIGFLVPGAAIIMLGYTEAGQSTQAVILQIVAVGMSAACYTGYAVNHMDLSPNHAGMLMGIANFCAQVFGVLAPLVAQALVKDETDPLQWRYVFFVAAGFYIVGALIFNIFGSGKVQWWNKEDFTDDNVEKTKL